jgi:hypothetical protein
MERTTVRLRDEARPAIVSAVVFHGVTIPSALNPGSAGPRRFNLPVSVARVMVGLGEPDVEVVRLSVGEAR